MPVGTGGRVSASIESPRGMGPGLRPRRSERAFSVRPIADSMPGIAAAAVSYCVRACSTVMRDTKPCSCCSSKSLTDSPYASFVRRAMTSCSS